jgi:hypothetical protein
MSAAGAAPMVGGMELEWEPEKLPAVSPASTALQDWTGDLLVLAVPEEAVGGSAEMQIEGLCDPQPRECPEQRVLMLSQAFTLH